MKKGFKPGPLDPTLFTKTYDDELFVCQIYVDDIIFGCTLCMYRCTYVDVLGTGVPRLACLRPTAWLKGGPSTVHLHQHRLKTLARGQASRGGRRGASSGKASSGWLTRRQRDQGRVPHEVPVTQAMTTKGARRVLARTASSFPLWCKEGKRTRGVPRHQAKVAISVQRDQDQKDGKTEVTMEPKTASDTSILHHAFCRRSRNGGPQTCLPAAHGVALRAGPYDPSSSTRH